jgi:hypothetical protein
VLEKRCGECGAGNSGGQGWFDAGVRVWKGKLEKERVPHRMQDVRRKNTKIYMKAAGHKYGSNLKNNLGIKNKTKHHQIIL